MTGVIPSSKVGIPTEESNLARNLLCSPGLQAYLMSVQFWTPRTHFNVFSSDFHSGIKLERTKTTAFVFLVSRKVKH